jgi:hypothetical protein
LSDSGNNPTSSTPHKRDPGPSRDLGPSQPRHISDVLEFSSSDLDHMQQPCPIKTEEKKIRLSLDGPSLPIILSSDSDTRTPSTSAKKLVWPHNFYTVDIAACFLACEDSVGSKTEQVFKTFFPIPFRQSTFHENWDHWRSAPPAAKEDALKAGHTSARLWIKFALKNPAPQAQKKAAHRKLACTGSNSSQENTD